MNDTGWKTLIEGGVYIGKLPKQSSSGAIVWNPIFANNEAHNDSHYYQISFYRWDRKNFKQYLQQQTKNKYTNSKDALRELNLNIEDSLKSSFPQLDLYR